MLLYQNVDISMHWFGNAYSKKQKIVKSSSTLFDKAPIIVACLSTVFTKLSKCNSKIIAMKG